MKKIHYYIIAAALPLMGMLTACTDENDWSKDGPDTSITANRLYTPSGLEIEVDSATFVLEAKFTGIGSAEKYQVQISENPLLEGFDETTGIATFEGTTSPIEIPRVSSNFEIKENTTYYVRIRAVSGSKVSKWVTDGKISGKKATLAPKNLWINAAGIDEDFLVLNWNDKLVESNTKEHYCNIGSIRNVNTGEVKTNTDIDFDAGSYQWDGLAKGTSYTFELIDTDGNIIGKVTAATETLPNMDWAMAIDDWGDIKQGDAATVTDTSGKFTIEVEGGAKIKTENDKSDFYLNPVKIMECPMKNGKRLTTGGKAGSLTLTLPGVTGRLYAYTHVGSSGAGRKMLVKRQSDEKAVEFLPPNTKISGVLADGSSKTGYEFQKIYIKSGDIDSANNKVTVKITWDASIYICGFCFVPDEQVQ